MMDEVERKVAPLAPINPVYRQDFRDDICTTDTGDVIVRWPARLTAEDSEMVCEWLAAIQAKTDGEGLTRGIVITAAYVAGYNLFRTVPAEAMQAAREAWTAAKEEVLRERFPTFFQGKVVSG